MILTLKKKKSGRPPHEKIYYVAETNRAKMIMDHFFGEPTDTFTVNYLIKIETLCTLHGIELTIKDKL